MIFVKFKNNKKKSKMSKKIVGILISFLFTVLVMSLTTGFKKRLLYFRDKFLLNMGYSMDSSFLNSSSLIKKMFKTDHQ